MKKPWMQALSALLTTGMVLSLLPGATLAAEAEPIYEYVEVTEAAALESGGVYAIVAPNSDHSILYHSHESQEMSDQVAGTVSGDKLFLNSSSDRFTRENQTWTLTAKDGGCTVASKADGHFLNFRDVSGSKVPVNDTEQALTIAKNPSGAGWSISAETGGVTYYLHHESKGQFSVNTLVDGASPTYFHIYRQTEVALNAPTLTGYELVTSLPGGNLDTDRYYMFVGKGANGKLYALLPGNGSFSPGEPQPGLTAELTVSEADGSITAKRLLDNTSITNLDSLFFRAFRYSGGKDTFASAEKTGLLLSLRNTMFTDVAGSMEVSVDAAGRVTLHSGSGRYLGLNIQGDAASALPAGDTGFYGPTANVGCPIYLFAKSGEENKVSPIDLTIPGYNRITSTTQLEIGSKYMIVSADSYGDLYALYPDPAAVGLFPGDGINPTSSMHQNGYTSVAAQLTTDEEKNTVSARRLDKEGRPESGDTSMETLHFTVERTGNTFYVKYGESLYLAMLDTGFLSAAPTELSITPDTTNVTSIYPSEGKFLVRDLHSGGNNARILDFNVTGDPIQFVSGSGTGYSTNFWGPRGKRYPIYIYEYVGIAETEHPERDRLQTVVTEVSKRDPDDYTPRSWEDFALALNAAQALLEGTPSEDDCTAALETLRNAGGRLVLNSAVLIPEAPSGTTQKQPFIADTTGGSKNFRIPGLITLSDGTLAATIDARWDHTADAKGIDTVFSYSTDNGETWRYSFPNFFADSINEKNSASKYAAAFIDPVVAAKGNDVYLLADLFPGGTALNSAPRTPSESSGYANIGDKQRLLVYTMNDSNENGQTDSNYTYYVGDFDGGYADLYDTSNNKTLYYVDRYYNLYRREKDVEDKVPENDKLHCRQWDGDDPYGAKYVQQNLFFYHSDLHVRSATYLWLLKGSYNAADRTFAWSEPTILNPPVRANGDGKFYGAGPGRGTVTESGTLILPAYTHPTQHSSVITSTDGVNWTRGASIPEASSEAAPVAVGDILYLFTRHNNNYYVSTDNGTSWSAATATGASYNTGCQLSAIHCSQKIDGKEAILLSAPAAGSRTNGKLFVFLVDETGNTLSLKCEYQVNGPGEHYGYSCLTELADGSIGLLYEDADAHVTFVTVPMAEIVKTGSIGDELYVHVPYYGETVVPMESETAAAIVAAVEGGAVVSAEADGTNVTFRGLRVGTLDLTLDGGKKVHITVDDGHLTRRSVTLRPGESKTYDLPLGGVVTFPGDAAVVTTAVSTEALSAAQGLTGADNTFSGQAVELSQALYTFTASGGGYCVESAENSGSYLSIFGAGNGGPGRPHSATPSEITLSAGSETNSFYIEDSKYLYFHRNGVKLHFDRNDNTNGNAAAACSMLLYRPAGKDETAGAELPGYVQVTGLDGVTSGGQYLIAAKYGDDYYVLNPSDSANNYGHVLKANSEKTVLTLTGAAAGRTDVVAGNVLYHVTVASDSANSSHRPSHTQKPDLLADCPRDASCPIASFSDASPTAWYHDGVHYCLEKGLMRGVSHGVFAPDTLTSRAMVVTILWRLQGCPVVNYLMVYDDVDQAAWYAEAVRWASAEGIVLGYGSGDFGPGDPVTREQLAAILCRYEQRLGGGVTDPGSLPEDFADRELISGWAREAMAWAVAQGLIQGKENGRLDPQGLATRAETATLFMRCLTR